MKSSDDCLARAVQMEHEAQECTQEAMRLDFLEMAKTWHWLARQALWQDRFTADSVVAAPLSA